MNLTFNLHDYQRLEMARLFWNGRARQALLDTWLDPRHPGRERFLVQRDLIIGLLEADDPQAFAETLRDQGHSLRTLIRDIPVIFPDWFREARIRHGLSRLPVSPSPRYQAV
ncbi:MAG: hypothetical protein ACFCUX_03120 [Candidatus Methylacidiphilales bacterium]